jgi:hypothetical protein
MSRLCPVTDCHGGYPAMLRAGALHVPVGTWHCVACTVPLRHCISPGVCCACYTVEYQQPANTVFYGMYGYVTVQLAWDDVVNFWLLKSCDDDRHSVTQPQAVVWCSGCFAWSLCLWCNWRDTMSSTCCAHWRNVLQEGSIAACH